MKNLKIKNFKTKKNQKLLRILIKFQKCWPNSRISTKLNHFGPLGEPRIAHTAENGPKHKLTLLNFASLRWSGVLLASLASDLNSALQGSCACIFVAGTSTLEEQCSGWWRGQGELQPVLRFEEHRQKYWRQCFFQKHRQNITSLRKKHDVLDDVLGSRNSIQSYEKTSGYLGEASIKKTVFFFSEKLRNPETPPPHL